MTLLHAFHTMTKTCSMQIVFLFLLLDTEKTDCEAIVNVPQNCEEKYREITLSEADFCAEYICNNSDLLGDNFFANIKDGFMMTFLGCATIAGPMDDTGARLCIPSMYYFQEGGKICEMNYLRFREYKSIFVFNKQWKFEHKYKMDTCEHENKNL